MSDKAEMKKSAQIAYILKLLEAASPEEVHKLFIAVINILE